MRSWRIVKKKYQHTAFDGSGARLYGGRWNLPGTAVVYTAFSRSLAILEILVHMNASGLLESYVLCPCEFDREFVQRVSPASLPSKWRQSGVSDKIQVFGDELIRHASVPVLQFPSAVVPQEENYLLLPEHPLFIKIRIGEPEPFLFDRRFRA
ncbi:MAG: RES family NAD+ phosphorylase [Acidobacteriaceae bacterium]|nr:RES family NAD+ phosphorylase [Acidobacteriaceae bacterium]MBV9781041.1 RES family NAD+ phosphorylase [Acidobacteriaceae bacterium]